MRAPPENANAARAGGGAAEALNKKIRPPSNSNAELLSQLQSSRDRLDELEQLSLWKLDLQVRLWRTQQRFLFADSNVDFGPLQAEVEDFRRIARVHAWRGGVRR
jgi:hypothetical protein